jgi:hypothetical protein
MTSSTAAIFIAAAGGMAVAIQAQFMGLMDRSIGNVEAVFITYCGGGVLIAGLMLLMRGGNLGAVAQHTLVCLDLGYIRLDDCRVHRIQCSQAGPGGRYDDCRGCPADHRGRSRPFRASGGRPATAGSDENSGHGRSGGRYMAHHPVTTITKTPRPKTGDGGCVLVPALKTGFCGLGYQFLSLRGKGRALK